LAKLWGHGLVDVEAIYDPKGISDYLHLNVTNNVTSYLQKNVSGGSETDIFDDLSFAMNWIFRKRSFSISGRALILTCTSQTTNKHQLLQMDLNMSPIPLSEGESSIFELVGMVNINFPGKPPPFSINLEQNQGLKQAVLSVIAGIVERENEEKKNWN
jgi:hypothetical protein